MLVSPVGHNTKGWRGSRARPDLVDLNIHRVCAP